jgi:pimeloyl-ACP methyl ester carboxylesterase
MGRYKSRGVRTNGIAMHLIEEGDGPLVVLCHGFPELGFSWRHQLPALAGAGYHAVAPDQRGYGRTDRPAAQDAYTLCHLVGDVVGLVQAMGEERAAIVGHNWGAPVAWTAALLRPDIFAALAILSVPYLRRLWSGPPPTEVMRQMLPPGHMFYQLYFQEPGRAEAELERDVRESFLRLFYAASGSAPPERRWRFVFSASEPFLETLPLPDRLPGWLTEGDLQVFVDEFSRTGFRGGLNWYRNMDRDRELLGFLSEARIRQPTLFLAGSEDAVVAMYRAAYDSLEESVPNLVAKILVPGSGHWIQQEKPEETTGALLQFLAQAFPARR